MACVGQLHVDWVCFLPSRYGRSSLAVGVASLRLLLCYGGMPEWEQTGGLFIAMRGLKAAAWGIRVPRVPQDFQLLG